MHPNATTTPEIRAAIQTSPDSIRALAARYGINPKTVAKWRGRPDTADRPAGRPARRTASLTPAEEAMCVGFRKHAKLPLDDCLYALQLKIPHLTRATLHRLYRRHGVSRLPVGSVPAGAPLGDFYVDTAMIGTGTGKLAIFIAFDRTSRFAYAELFEAGDAETGARFLANLAEAVPYVIQAVLTSDSPAFTGPSPAHPFAALCRRNGIAHRLIPPGDPWAVGTQGEARRRPSGPFYRDHGHLRAHFFAFFDTYNFTRRLKTLDGRTPYEFICARWETEPGLFRRPPARRLPRLLHEEELNN